MPGSVRLRVTPQQERFVRLVVSGMDPAEAYIAAGYQLGPGNNAPSKVKRRAGDLLLRPHIQRRVGELEPTAAGAAVEAVASGAKRMVMDAIERQHWTRAAIMRLVEKATHEGAYDAALDALRMLGADAGMWADMVEQGQQAAPPTSSVRRAVNREAAAVGAAAAGAVTAGIVAGADIMDKLRQARNAPQPGDGARVVNVRAITRTG